MNRIFSFSIVGTIVLLAIVGCGSDTNCPGEIGFVGSYGGEHTINIPSVGIPLPTGDSLFVTDPTNGDNQVSAFSVTLNSTLNCRISASNCTKVTIDTIHIDSTSIAGITIKDVVAAGDGDLNGNQLITRINILSGMAYNIPIYGNKDLTGTRINGIFNK